MALSLPLIGPVPTSVGGKMDGLGEEKERKAAACLGRSLLRRY